MKARLNIIIGLIVSSMGFCDCNSSTEGITFFFLITGSSVVGWSIGMIIYECIEK